MMLSVVSVDGMSKKKLKNRALDYFYDPKNRPKNLPYSILLRNFGMNVLFLEKGIIFDSYKDLPVQKKFVTNCIDEIFNKTVLAYECTEGCDWMSDLKDIQAYKI